MPAPSTPLSLQDLIDRATVSDTILNYATAIDRRDWSLYRSIFADEVEFDFQTWSGAPPAMVSGDDWVTSVRETLACFDATAHVITNHVITLSGDTATIVAHMTATHYFAGEVQVLGGYYTDRLVRHGLGWKIVGCQLIITWEQGNRGLFERAKLRGPQARIDVGTMGI
ncbi:MAG: SnoaL-like domain protein [Sphingomonadales bacterium]|nr:SnoaL-like domain protein [Sphingomonadales bacterium]